MQRGMALLEALVSLAILALGVLGLAAVQARMLVETRTTNSRAVAIRLIGELSERVQLNVTGATVPTTPTVGRSAYSDSSAAAFLAPPASWPPSTDCLTTVCTPAQQATYDLAAWRRDVATALLGGRASVWQISPRQLQVVIAWQANESAQPVLSDTAPPPAASQVANGMRITAAAAGGICGASSTTLCHIDFIDIPPNK